MIGKHQLVIDASEFLKGMSSGADISDGGFSIEATAGMNLQVSPGIIYPAADATDSDTDTRLTDEIIVSSSDMTATAGVERLVVTEDAKFYQYNGTKIAAATYTDSGTASTYTKGFSDLITFDGEAYITATARIKRWQNGGTITDLTGGTFGKTTCPHPAIVFENNAYYADQNTSTSAGQLWRQTAANTAPAVILTFTIDQIITALGIDPGTGKMLIATINTMNMSNTLPVVTKIHWYDGFSNKVLKTIIVDEMVTAFYPVGGIVYVGYGQNIGYLNGSGITFLRKLANVTLNQQDLPWKHSFANIGRVLYVIDGAKILAFGEVLPGKKIFWYAYINEFGTSVTNKFKCIFNAGQNKLGISVETAKFATVDTSSIATMGADAFDFISNWYSFPRPVHLRTALIETLNSMSSANYTIQYKGQNDSSYKNLSQQEGTQTAFRVKNIIGFQDPVFAAKFKIANSNQIPGLKRMIITYDYAE